MGSERSRRTGRGVQRVVLGMLCVSIVVFISLMNSKRDSKRLNGSRFDWPDLGGCDQRWRMISVMLTMRGDTTLTDTTTKYKQPNLSSNLSSPRPNKVYRSSEWEKLWLENIEIWQDGKICEALATQKAQVQKFMTSMCSALTETVWCLVDDSVKPFWYNRESGEMRHSKPWYVRRVDRITPVTPTDSTIFSSFSWTSSTGVLHTSYIEPLVGHLRHPLSGCTPDHVNLVLDRSYIVPPSLTSIDTGHKLYFDAGASSWSEGLGGPSLSYFTNVWERHGIQFDRIEGWEGGTEVMEFYCSVPDKYLPHTYFHQEWISSSLSTSGAKNPFVPSVIRQQANKEDYVLFKLDIDSGNVEKGTIDHFLSDDNDDIDYIDELFWEQHVRNYIMAPSWRDSIDKTLSIADSYRYFLRLRQKGVRAHSWI